jgi:hypothetical protein
MCSCFLLVSRKAERCDPRTKEEAPVAFRGKQNQTSCARRLKAIVFGFIVLAAIGVPPKADAAPGFKICEDQTYALCALASCFVLNGVSYCKCVVKNGDSISLAFNYSGGDVCSINADGVGNGYMLSTFSVPVEARPGGNKAIYTCPAATSDGAYAQCDGGTCFTSTRGQEFPGFAEPLKNNEIICSCPITEADPSSALIGHQIAGPFPCQASFFANCRNASAHTRTGGTVYVGAPTGVTAFLSKELTGSTPTFNQCPPVPPPRN